MNQAHTWFYHVTSELFQEVEALSTKHPDVLRREVLVDEKTGLEMVFVTASNFSQPLADNGNEKLRMLLVFGEHGRELISSEVALQLLRYLAGYTVSPFSGLPGPAGYGQLKLSLWVKVLLRNVEFVIVPLESVWSREEVERGRWCTRKNENGVDLNRNYPFMFASNRVQQGHEEYQGSEPFSEPQSRILRDYSNAHKLHLFANIHSGIEELYIPWDHKPSLPENSLPAQQLLDHLDSQHCNCVHGGAGAVASYLVFGSSMDYFWEVMKLPYSLTFEVYGEDARDCFTMFNPKTQTSMNRTITNWAVALLTTADYLLTPVVGVERPDLDALVLQASISPTPPVQRTDPEVSIPRTRPPTTPPPPPLFDLPPPAVKLRVTPRPALSSGTHKAPLGWWLWAAVACCWRYCWG